MQATKLFKDFFESERSGGLTLIICTLLSLILANTAFGAIYHHFWDQQIFGHSLEHWINDGLMTIFFLLIGLELEREIYIGELSKLKDALLPLFAALGGMIFQRQYIYILIMGLLRSLEQAFRWLQILPSLWVFCHS